MKFLSKLCCLRRRREGCEEGSALVETALVLPLMMIFVTGITSFGMMLNQYLVLCHATDVGARNLAMSRGTSTTPCTDAETVIQGAAPNLKSSSLTYSFTIGSGTFSGSNLSGSGSSSCSVAGVSDMVAGANATITVTYPFTLTFYGWSPSTINLSASTSEVIQ